MNKRGKSLIIAGVAVFFLIFLTIGFVIADNLVSDLNNYEDNYKTAVFDNAKATILTPITGNKVVDSTHNLTIDYSVYIPIKAGYNLGTYLPIRIGYWNYWRNINYTYCL